jgi:hypothetical protein
VTGDGRAAVPVATAGSAAWAGCQDDQSLSLRAPFPTPRAPADAGSRKRRSGRGRQRRARLSPVARMARFDVRSGSLTFACSDRSAANASFKRTRANGRERCPHLPCRRSWVRVPSSASFRNFRPVALSLPARLECAPAYAAGGEGEKLRAQAAESRSSGPTGAPTKYSMWETRRKRPERCGPGAPPGEIRQGPHQTCRQNEAPAQPSVVSVPARKVAAAASVAAKLFSASQPPSIVSATPFT